MKSLIKKVIFRIKNLLRFKRIYAQPIREFDHTFLVEDAKFFLPDKLPNGKPWPKISVITPSFNQGCFIAENIESVLNQSYPNVEHIIIDGGSTDETMQVIQRYRAKLAHVISEADQGQSDALNKGFRLATGEILCWLNSDDQFAPGALIAVAMGFSTKDVDIISGICEVYEEGQLIHRHMSACEDGPLPLMDMLDLENAWNAGQFFYQPEVFFSRSIWEKVGSHVRNDCFYSMDYELWCRFALVGARLHVIGTPLAKFRVHPAQKTADPSKFKKELIDVRNKFAVENSIHLLESIRPKVQFDRRLRVAMINDVGLKYGAGIAHGRLAAGMDMAGHDVKLFDLCSRINVNGELDEASLVEDVIEFNPTVVIFGNLHTATRDSVFVVKTLSLQFPTFWLSHDFWIITGRCAYPGECSMYLTGCDERCPTSKQYPDLALNKINTAWLNKQELMSSQTPPFILANSEWTANTVKKSLDMLKGNSDSQVKKVKLGAPVQLFKPLDRIAARTALGIKQDQFIIAFSVSALGEKRKGGHYLIEALDGISLSNVSVILIGYLDKPFVVTGVETISLGYVTDTSTLTAAISAADVYVGPSIEETFGQVFIEAALSGIPSIGFNQSGVRDAIVNGVTGLLISPTADALRNAICQLYYDRDFCKSLGLWARIYALNEFSLESSYQSLFLIWRSLGMVDKWGLPHRVGFAKKSSIFVEETMRYDAHWRPLIGISSTEGPYPNLGLPTKFNWCHGSKSRLMYYFPKEGRYLMRVIYYNTLFPGLEVNLYFNDNSPEVFTLSLTDSGNSEFIEFEVNTNSGASYIDIVPNQMYSSNESEPRMLTFMLLQIESHRTNVVLGYEI